MNVKPTTTATLTTPFSYWNATNIEAERTLLRRQGWFYLSGLPADFQWVAYIQQVTQATLMPQDAGELIYSVKARPGCDRESGSRSRNPLRPHTELSWRQNPPQYVGLWCKTPSGCGGGATTFLDGHDWLSQFTPEEQQHLLKRRYHMVSENRTQRLHAPIVDFPSPHQLRLRFSYNVLRYGEPSPPIDAPAPLADAFLETVCDRTLSYFNTARTALRMERYSLLILDNGRMLHSRTGYSDPNRHLERVLLT